MNRWNTYIEKDEFQVIVPPQLVISQQYKQRLTSKWKLSKIGAASRKEARDK